MKSFLSTVKGKIIAGAATLAIIAAAIVVIVLLNTGYRTIRAEDLNGTTTITAGGSVSKAVKGQNLKSGCDVFVEERSDLTLALDEDKHVYAKELTRFSLEAVGKPGKDSRTVIRLDEGSVLSEIDEKLGADESYTIESPNATMAVRGTVFTVTVSYDEEGLCHTLIEVEEGKVEVTEKDENGDPTDEVQTLEADGKFEVISLVINRNEGDETPGSGNGDSSSDEYSDPGYMEKVYQNPEAIAVENAIEAYLNGGELDTTNFDMVTSLEIYGKVAFVTLDEQFGGKGRQFGMSWSDSDNEIEYVSYWSDTDEEIEIPTSNSSLTDLSFLTGMERLRQLTILFGNVTDVTVIGQLSGLIDLNLNYNNISDISPLENLTKLIALHLSHNNISDISAVKGMKNLWIFGSSYNNISDISPLGELKRLENLSLSDNSISDLSPISGLTNLTYLYINSDNISDISPISRLTNLTELDLNGDNISDLSPISGLTNLTHLEILSDNVSDISPIANLKKLEYLTMWSDSINDYSPLYGLTDLQVIDLEMIEDDELSKLQQALPEASITSIEF